MPVVTGSYQIHRNRDVSNQLTAYGGGGGGGWGSMWGVTVDLLMCDKGLECTRQSAHATI
jgi:hypothetical protein